MAKVPISIITGYLGSGKTTLLKRIIEQTDKRIAIVMNEFGEIAIDSKIIKGKNMEMAELAGGCVCCSISGEFELAIREIMKKVKPDMIIVETTGVAEPDALVFDIEENLPEIKLDSIITVVDADGMVRFPSLGETGRIQIEMADIIVINKVDLVNEEQMQEVEKSVKELNDDVIVLRAVRCDVDIHVLFGLEAERHVQKREHDHREIESFMFSSDKKINLEEFTNIISNLPKEVYRAKGLLKTDRGSLLFNYVAGRFDFEDADAEKTEVILIGENVSKKKSEILKKLKSAIA